MTLPEGLEYYHNLRRKKVHYGRGQLFSYRYMNKLLPSQSYTVCTGISHWRCFALLVGILGYKWFCPAAN